MNERIQLLAEQATTRVDAVPNESMAYTYFDTNMFAELIVTETISVLQKRFMGDLNREDMEVRKCIEDVKNHFAVKE